MKIPIKHAINSGAWFQCRSDYYEIDFRVRCLSFKKIALHEIDDREKLDSQFDLKQGNFWLLSYEAINLNKQAHGNIPGSILIHDNDDFSFSSVYDSHLCYDSKVGKSSGLDKSIVGWLPKIKYLQVHAYFLPNEDNAEYFIAIKEGIIQEI